MVSVSFSDFANASVSDISINGESVGTAFPAEGVEAFSTVTLKITPDDGFKIASVKLDDGSEVPYDEDSQSFSFTLETNTLISVTVVDKDAVEPEVFVTLAFNSTTMQKGVSGYSGVEFNTIVDDYTWTINNFNNNNKGWSSIKTGSKNDAVTGKISAKFDEKVLKVVMKTGAVTTNNGTSTTLKVYTDDTYSTLVESVSGNIVSNGSVTFEITNPGTGYGYVIEIACEKSTNGCVEVTSVDYYTTGCNHNWSDWGQTKAPTCAELGEETRTCSVCNKTETRDVDKIAHVNIQHTEAKDAACGAEGNREYWYCDDCKQYFSDNACTTVTSLKEVTIKATGNHVDADEDGKCDVCEADMNSSGDTGTETPTEKTLLATFDDFSKNSSSSSSHSDGSNASTSTIYTDSASNYTLQFTTLTNVSDNAFDGKGNSCLKLGTSKKTGSFTFKVLDDVTEVKIYVAKYKTNDSKIKINSGDETNIAGNSNDGVYDVFTIDTSKTKEITLETASGGLRVMVDKIEYYG